MSQSNKPDASEQEAGFISHLIELRDRLMRAVLAVLLVFLGLFPFAKEIYGYLSGPLQNLLPEGTSMIATGIADPFLIPFKLVMMVALVVALPYVLYQIWGFIAPGLYKHERRLALPMLASSVVLFYAGMAFAYFVVFKLIFGFFIGAAPEGVAVAPDIGYYLDFVLMLFLAFGIAFETPIATILVVSAGLITPDELAKKRPYIVVAALVIGMFLTPPDVISQILLAVPIWILFEAGVLFSRLIVKKKEAPAQNLPLSADDFDDEEHHPLSDEEMEAELDAIEREEAMDAGEPKKHPE